MDRLRLSLESTSKIPEPTEHDIISDCPWLLDSPMEIRQTATQVMGAISTSRSHEYGDEDSPQKVKIFFAFVVVV